MIRGILRGLWRRPVASLRTGGAYRIFTPAFDREVRAADLDAVLGSLPLELEAERDAAWTTFRETLAFPDKGPARSPLRAGETTVTLLLDQSGSMRGRPMALAAAAIAHAVRVLSGEGVRVEVLGFTTASWQGGRPRRLWKRLMRPPRPGRLCELLHILYRGADETAPDLSEDVLRAMLRPDLPKENVDGEALLWAADRLLACEAARRILVVMSDGSPVDDSSQQANGPLFLDAHLRDVIAAIAADGRIELAAVGVGYDVSGWYPRTLTLGSAEEFGSRLGEFLAALLNRPA